MERTRTRFAVVLVCALPVIVQGDHIEVTDSPKTTHMSTETVPKPYQAVFGITVLAPVKADYHDRRGGPDYGSRTKHWRRRDRDPEDKGHVLVFGLSKKEYLLSMKMISRGLFLSPYLPALTPPCLATLI